MTNINGDIKGKAVFKLRAYISTISAMNEFIILESCKNAMLLIPVCANCEPRYAASLTPPSATVRDRASSAASCPGRSSQGGQVARHPGQVYSTLACVLQHRPCVASVQYRLQTARKRKIRRSR